MGEWPEATYAALCQTYSPRDPLAEFARGDLPLDTLRVLVEHLPLDSPRHRAEVDLQGWTATDYLLAQVIDEMTYLGRIVIAVGSGAEGEIDRPEPFARPRDARSITAQAQADEHAALSAREWFAENVT